jgi:hypothetical protein
MPVFFIKHNQLQSVLLSRTILMALLIIYVGSQLTSITYILVCFLPLLMQWGSGMGVIVNNCIGPRQVQRSAYNTGVQFQIT